MHINWTCIYWWLANHFSAHGSWRPGFKSTENAYGGKIGRTYEILVRAWIRFLYTPHQCSVKIITCSPESYCWCSYSPGAWDWVFDFFFELFPTQTSFSSLGLNRDIIINRGHLANRLLSTLLSPGKMVTSLASWSLHDMIGSFLSKLSVAGNKIIAKNNMSLYHQHYAVTAQDILGEKQEWVIEKW